MRSQHVHLIEPGGGGGIHHHAVALAAALAAGGLEVELHTAANAEVLRSDLDGVRRHSCVWHLRRLRVGPVRRLALCLGWVLVGVPSCLVRVRRGDIAHVQGLFRPTLLAPLLVGLRCRGCTIVLTPHNTFSRQGRSGEERLLHWLARRADLVVTFSEHDRARVESWGAQAVRAPFPVPSPPAPCPESVAAWRRRWSADGEKAVVLLPGHLRPDKGLDLAIRAAVLWGDDVVLAVVGQDGGALAAARRLAGALAVRVMWDEGYRPFDEFLAAVAAADVVVCPYRAASQSAVLALARVLGRPAVATAVGGLAELATVAVAPDDPAALAVGVRRALLAAPPAPVPQDPIAIAEYYKSVYGLVGERMRPSS